MDQPLLPARQSSEASSIAVSSRYRPLNLDSPRVTSPAQHRRSTRTRAARRVACVLGLVVAICAGGAPTSAPAGEPRYAIAMHGEPALPEGFTAARYVDPEAP